MSPLSRVNVPPCSSARVLANGRPIPKLCEYGECSSLYWINGLKISSFLSSGIFGPSFLNDTVTYPSPESATSMFTNVSAYFMALARRLFNILIRAASSALIISALSGCLNIIFKFLPRAVSLKLQYRKPIRSMMSTRRQFITQPCSSIRINSRSSLTSLSR